MLYTLLTIGSAVLSVFISLAAYIWRSNVQRTDKLEEKIGNLENALINTRSETEIRQLLDDKIYPVREGLEDVREGLKGVRDRLDNILDHIINKKSE